jgi:hypothetical protein
MRSSCWKCWSVETDPSVPLDIFTSIPISRSIWTTS